ncbi:MAG: hypothetical protein ACI4RD_04575 [Kiritimatiellia bacterium]
MKMKQIMSVAAAGLLAVALTGCASSPVRFLESSAPIPANGYTIAGSEVTGTSDQVWVFGIGGSTGLQQTRAFRDAMSKSQKADALISMSIEEHLVNVLFFTRKTISVTGIPVIFNK